MNSPTRQESEFISASRLLMIGGLVYHHLFEIPGSSHSPRLNMEKVVWFFPEFINSFFHMAFMTAVPLLSVISGYLFFCRPKIDFRDLLVQRLFSVAIPSWLWSGIWLIFAYSLYSISSSYEWFPGADYGFAQSDWMIWVNGIFGVTREPFAFQFWFVHDLMLTLLLTQVIHFFLIWLGWRLLVPVAIIWILVPYPPVFFSGNVLMFFVVGAWLALPDSPSLTRVLEKLQEFRWSLLILFIVVLTLRLMSHKLAALNDVMQGYIYLCVLRITGVLTASALIYHMVRHMQILTRLIVRYSGYSFLIFAAHYPLIEIIQKPVLLIPGHDSALGLTISWMLIPLFTIVLILALSSMCKIYLPELFAVLNGGRHGQLGIMSSSLDKTDTKNIKKVGIL